MMGFTALVKVLVMLLAAWSASTCDVATTMAIGCPSYHSFAPKEDRKTPRKKN